MSLRTLPFCFLAKRKRGGKRHQKKKRRKSPCYIFNARTDPWSVQPKWNDCVNGAGVVETEFCPSIWLLQENQVREFQATQTFVEQHLSLIHI